MKRKIRFLHAWILLPMAMSWAGAQEEAIERQRADVEFMASDALEGREAGKPGNEATALFIRSRLTQMGFRPLPGAKGMLLPFGFGSLRCSNVAAWIPGSKDEVVVVGAHFDHIGHGESSAMSRDSKDELYNGANDNASGVAGILEIARILHKENPVRGLVVVAFNAEEKGLFGSQDFSQNLGTLLEGKKVVAMINLDMIGNMPDGIVQIFGAGCSKELTKCLDSSAKNLNLKWEDIGYISLSDHHHFYKQGIPCLFAFCGINENYHGPNDEFEAINYKNMSITSIFLADVTRLLIESDANIDFSKISNEIIDKSMKSIKRSMLLIPLGVDLNDNYEIIKVYKCGYLTDFNLKVGYKLLSINNIVVTNNNLKKIVDLKNCDFDEIVVLFSEKRIKTLKK